MTLKEKLKSEIIAAPVMDEVIEYWTSELEQIADEISIGFAEWLVFQYAEDIIYDKFNTEQLLEIYKKEKGL